MKLSVKDSLRTGGWIIIILAVIGFMTIISGLTDTHEMMFQSVPVLLSVIVTAIITGTLLERQTSGEERREKNVHIHTNKIAAYSEFISNMWGVLDGEMIDRNKIGQLRAEMFNKLIFYLDNKVINLILQKMQELREDIDRLENGGDDDSSDKKAARCRRIFADITAILRNDINPQNSEDCDLGTDASHIRQLWGAIDSFVNDGDMQEASCALAGGELKGLKNRCFHFNAWGWEYQKSLWSEVHGELYPLFMCEYGESWRTDFLRTRIHENDLIFLYRSSGRGYVGVSRAKGYVTVEFGSGPEDMKCRIHSYKTGETQLIDNRQLQIQAPEYAGKLIALYEQYRTERSVSDDGPTYYSYLYVEPILLYADGVGSSDVYSRTISPFDPRTARLVYLKFKKLVDEGRIDESHIDRTLFNAIAAENGIE